MTNNSLEKPFPMNIFDELGEEAPAEQPYDFIPTLSYVLQCIASPRDARAFMMRYKDGKTYEQIGIAMQITKQRAHIIVNGVLDHITADYRTMLKRGIKQYAQDLLDERIEALGSVLEENERIALQEQAYNQGYDAGFNNGLLNRPTDNVCPAVNNIRLATLGLSNRTKNALARNGVTTIGDFLKCGDECIHFLTFGRKCFNELIGKLKRYDDHIADKFPMAMEVFGGAQ